MEMDFQLNLTVTTSNYNFTPTAVIQAIAKY